MNCFSSDGENEHVKGTGRKEICWILLKEKKKTCVGNRKKRQSCEKMLEEKLYLLVIEGRKYI